MYKRIFIIYSSIAVLIISASLFQNVKAQSNTPQIMYSYDAAGNRIQRKVIVLGTDEPVQPPPATPNRQASNTNSSNIIYEKLGAWNMAAYPNPTDSKVIVKIKDLPVGIKGSVTVIDITGKVIFQTEHIGDSNEIDLSNQAAGTYFIKIMAAEKTGEIAVIKIH
jgi:hypothetical protein